MIRRRGAVFKPVPAALLQPPAGPGSTMGYHPPKTMDAAQEHDSETPRDGESGPGGLYAVLLAAGGSARLGQAKQLVEFHGETLLAHAARRLAETVGWERVCVVLGAQSARMRTELNTRIGAVVCNERWRDGMSGSLRRGLEAIPDCAAGVLISLSDQPLADPGPLARAWYQSDGEAIVAARYPEGGAGVPAVFPRALFGRLRALTGEHGAREIIRAESERVIAVAAGDTLLDVDTAGDLARLRELERSGKRHAQR